MWGPLRAPSPGATVSTWGWGLLATLAPIPSQKVLLFVLLRTPLLPSFLLPFSEFIFSGFLSEAADCREALLLSSFLFTLPPVHKDELTLPQLASLPLWLPGCCEETTVPGSSGAREFLLQRSGTAPTSLITPGSFLISFAIILH